MLLDDTTVDKITEQNKMFLPWLAGFACEDYRGEMPDYLMPKLLGTIVKEASHPVSYASGPCVWSQCSVNSLSWLSQSEPTELTVCVTWPRDWWAFPWHAMEHYGCWVPPGMWSSFHTHHKQKASPLCDGADGSSNFSSGGSLCCIRNTWRASVFFACTNGPSNSPERVALVTRWTTVNSNVVCEPVL